MILLLGATSYIGRAFAREFRARGEKFVPLSRTALDYTRFELLFDYVRSIRPTLIINAGGSWDDPDADDLEHARTEMFQANTLLPQTVGRVCTMTNLPWAHVSSSAIYAGAKVFMAGELKVQRDLNEPRVRRLFAREPENFLGFNELDPPNSCFRSPPCSYNAGTKALAEEWLADRDGVYIWRTGMPFSNTDNGSNILSQLMSRDRVFDDFIALSHVHDFARACLQLLERHAPFGTYNVVNPGALTTREITAVIRERLKPGRRFQFWKNQTEYLLNRVPSLNSSCIMDSGKIVRTGIKLRSARAAVEAALDTWQGADENGSNGEPHRIPDSTLRIVR